jgi:hypothetical protein
MTDIARPIDRVNDVFQRTMGDPGTIRPSSFEKLHRHQPLTVERHASLALPDLKTIVVVQDRRNVDDVQPLMLRTPRVAEVAHRISVFFARRNRRTELVSIGLSYHGLAPDQGDLNDEDEMAELRDVLSIPKTKNILSVDPVKHDIPLQPCNFYFDPAGELQTRHHIGMFDSAFSFLANAVVLNTTDPKVLKPTNNR